MRISERLSHKRPVFSFEFFPPKHEKGERVLWRSLEQLRTLEPDFVSVTYGAGGSTRERTVELVARIKTELGIEPMAHLTCVGSTRDELARVVERLLAADVHNILALRGDPPKGETEFQHTPGGFRYASELTAWLRESWPELCIGAACYPEVHPEASDAEADLAALKTKVDAGVDFLITQLFFDNAAYFEFENRARGAGIEVPIIPGIMPVTNIKQIRRFTKMCGATIPPLLQHRLDDIASAEGGPHAHEVFWAGVSYAAHQCRGLLDPGRGAMPFGARTPGVHGIHFYTLNRSPATRALFEILRLSRTAS
ncbi:5,10-methylenetetrahydrofolate reductase [Plesiocystis pacifica SIR-1]|uniref:Methylenetetrahydrofolate reductase n=1 Tax=Plesiocystis pacifica SIR-1 TaxID=391625 RepID=A6G2Q2_9BACT|nr:methylenetetrahydrofolate reductase [NAD(P)H] [Plesiocystis pacifica]EDM79752.1 5,10-methylenetetrahydrofolate reductase [Plesiocystis pacifica SIR-1]